MEKGMKIFFSLPFLLGSQFPIEKGMKIFFI
jgi:hypothetical protein